MADEHGRFAWVYRSEGHRCRKPPRLDQERAVIARRKIEGFTPLCRLQGGGKLGGAGDCDRGCDARCGYTYRREHRKVQQLHRRGSFEREKTDAHLLVIVWKTYFPYQARFFSAVFLPVFTEVG